MKFVGSVLRSANFGLSRHVQRRVVIESLKNPLPAFVETSSPLHVSGFKLRGRSFVVAVSSDTPEAKKAGKRISKNERKAMVEAFVCKYRSMNDGKFPTVSNAKKEVGGSYYTVRQILQELEYNSRMPPEDTRKATSKGSNTVEKNTSKDGMETSFLAVENLNYETGSISATRGKSGVEAQSHRLPGKVEGSLHSHIGKTMCDSKYETGSEDMQKFDGLKVKTERQSSPDLGNLERELSKEPTEDAEPYGKSSVWNNLKSLVNNIIGGWRKS